MIRLLFLVPYPELKEKVDYVLKNYSGKEKVEADIRVWTVEEIPSVPADEYDAMIARGYTAKKMEENYPAVPTIDMPVSGYDIVRALDECQEKYHPKKIVICGFFGKLYEAKDICRMFGTKAEIYSPSDYTELNEMMKEKKIRNCDVLVGGYSATIYAKKQGIPSILVRTGEDTILQAVNEAVRTVVKIRQERLAAQMYRTIINSSKEGIFYVNHEGILQVQNRAAAEMSGKIEKKKKEDAVRAGNMFPFLKRELEEVLAGGRELTGKIYTLPGTKTTVSVDLVPVIVGKKVSGAIINFSDVTRIQELEGTIRRKLSSTGLTAKYYFDGILYESAVMQRAIETAKKYAASDSNIMIVGETGTGKELFAQSIHNASPRKDGPFVAINCAALPENLLESELFGYVEGAFTGTSKGGKMGLFEQAHGGTLFLDEIGEVSMSTQTKLLRALQEREVRRIGDNKIVSVNVRIIAATNRSISRMAEEGTFRRDLMYRLDVLRLYLPPLRERKGDIRLLFCRLLKGAQTRIGEGAFEALECHKFSGNIRELENIAERVRVLYGEQTVGKDEMMKLLYPDDVENKEKTERDCGQPAVSDEMDRDGRAEDSKRREMHLDGTERERIEEALKMCEGNQKKAADLLGMDRTTLWRKRKKYQL